MKYTIYLAVVSTQFCALCTQIVVCQMDSNSAKEPANSGLDAYSMTSLRRLAVLLLFH